MTTVNIVLHVNLHAPLDYSMPYLIVDIPFLSPSVQRKGSWVVERVVGQAELRAPDHTLREQMSRLQVIGM